VVMNIGLNVTDFFPGEMGGIETYFRELLHHLQRVDRRNDYTILCVKPRSDQFPLFNPSFRVREYGFARRSPAWLVRTALRRILGRDPLGPLIGRLSLDVIHHPFSVARPRVRGIPSVVTFWDMQHEFYPDFFPRKERERRRWIYRESAEEATRIIVAAEFTRRCLAEKYGIDERKIDLVPVGCGPAFRVLDDPEGAEAIREKYDLAKPFLFYPAATWPHKNHRNLLAALEILMESHRFDGELVLTGIAKEGHAVLLGEAKRPGLSGVVRMLGYVPYEDLPRLYNLARLLVFPSLFEGFGIPVLEAMACGCPVVCSDVTSLPEILGDAGLTFDPESPEDIALKILSAWEDGDHRTRMRSAGLARAKRYSWENNAKRTIDSYAKACGEGAQTG